MFIRTSRLMSTMMLFIVVLLPLAAHTTDPTDEPLSKEGGGLLDAVTISCIFAIISALCISAGVGGGSVFGPLLNGGMFGLTAPLEAHQSAALSITLVTFSAIAAAMVNIRSGSVDYGACLLIVPAANAGTVIGVTISKACPDWFILLVTVLFLSWVAYSTYGKFIKTRRKENPNELSRPLLTEVNDSKVVAVEAEGTSWVMVGELLLAWMAVWLMTLILGGHRTSSILGLQMCSPAYWGVSTATVITLMTISMIRSRQLSFIASVASTPETHHQPRHHRSSTLAYSFLSFLGGIICAVIGIGGGMIYVPLLLRLGRKPTVATATSAIAVLMTSSIAAGQLAMEGHIVSDRTLLYGLSAFLGALVGTLYITKAVEKHGRQSRLILLLLVIVVTSVVMAAVVGVRKVLTDQKLQGFSDPCIGIVHDMHFC